MATEVSCSTCIEGITYDSPTIHDEDGRPVANCCKCMTRFGECIECRQFTARVEEAFQCCVNPECSVRGIEFERCLVCGNWSLNRPNDDLPSATRFCHNPRCSTLARSTENGASGPTVSESSFVPAPAGHQTDIDRIDSLLSSIASQSHYEERYEVSSRIAHGGMGEILEAYDLILQRKVAIKRMLRSAKLGSDPIMRGQFLKEARIGGRLLHPNVLSVFDVGVDRDERIYYTMRLVDGASLQSSLGALQTGVSTRLVGYPIRRIVRSFLGACHGVDFAHQNQILHLDLKPHNILMSGFEEVFVIDWGLARLDDHDDIERLADLYYESSSQNGEDGVSKAEYTMIFEQDRGRAVGTPTYMAPEQARAASQHFDETTDVYGLGGILHFILYGCGPNNARTANEVIQQSAGEKPGPKQRLRDGILPRGKRVRDRIIEQVRELEAICRKCLNVQQDQRFATVDDLIVEIDEWLVATSGLSEHID